MELFTDTSSTKTYAKRDTAVKAARKIAQDVGMHYPRFIMSISEDGRFFPVFVVQSMDQHLAINLASNGFCVTG